MATEEKAEFYENIFIFLKTVVVFDGYFKQMVKWAKWEMGQMGGQMKMVCCIVCKKNFSQLS
jgi:hypothetical protein